MARAHILGFPRIGGARELKFALESFWRGETSEASLRQTGTELRERHWAMQRDSGLHFVSAGDFMRLKISGCPEAKKEQP